MEECRESMPDSREAAMGQTKSLLDWYDRERRILPWREDPSPYHVWISEIMLQQTRVEAVKRYYERFLERLPDIRSLAEAEEDTYLKLWEGLGYYSRVRNLHKAAVMVMEEMEGRLPEKASDLKRLPGIGDYTSAAIASIAFGERVCALDGNLLR
ncbi:MAG: A/G-specific adenine glycosylase, partial [bacterium]